eukprot:1149300-Pelagomonas_calceolata.AAC.5
MQEMVLHELQQVYGKDEVVGLVIPRSMEHDKNQDAPDHPFHFYICKSLKRRLPSTNPMWRGKNREENKSKKAEKSFPASIKEKDRAWTSSFINLLHLHSVMDGKHAQGVPRGSKCARGPARGVCISDHARQGGEAQAGKWQLGSKQVIGGSLSADTIEKTNK